MASSSDDTESDMRHTIITCITLSRMWDVAREAKVLEATEAEAIAAMHLLTMPEWGVPLIVIRSPGHLHTIQQGGVLYMRALAFLNNVARNDVIYTDRLRAIIKQELTLLIQKVVLAVTNQQQEGPQAHQHAAADPIRQLPVHIARDDEEEHDDDTENA